MASSTITEKDRQFAHSIGPVFVKQYYTSLAGHSLERHDAFYGKDSVFSFNGEAAIMGAQNIKEKYVSLGFDNVFVDLEGGTFDFAASLGGGVMVAVGGAVTFANSETKPFSQIFFLAPDVVNGKTSYFVLNDIFRFMEVKAKNDIADTTVEQSAPGDIGTIDVESNNFEEEDAEAEKYAEISEELQEVPSEKMDESVDAEDEEPEEIEPATNAGREPLKVAEAPKQVKPSSWASVVSSQKVDAASSPKAPAPPTPVGKSAPKDTSKPPQKPAVNGTTRNPAATVFVKDLDKDVTEASLRNVFTPFGTVKAININRERRYAYVDFDSPASVEKALANPVMLEGKELSVQERSAFTGRSGPSRRGRGNYRGDRSGKDKDRKQANPQGNTGNSSEKTRAKKSENRF